ncbi:MAG: M13 family peptidase [Planctomycetes bacterium]|nr:M13 family peptidase [Planctomycetota bacterium]
MKRLVLTLVVLASLIGEAHAQDERHVGIDISGLDMTVRPQDDLFRHVNGRWLLTTEIPADKSNYGSFTALADAAQENVRAIIEESAKQPADELACKIGDFYQSYMNEELITRKWLDPLRGELSAIDDLATIDDVIAYFGRAVPRGIDGPVGFYIDIDDRNSSRYVANIVQNGLTLPDRDYYLEDKDNYRNARQALTAYVVRLYELAKLPGGTSAAKDILALETSLARVHWSKTELRDAEKRYNLYRTTDLKKLNATWAWSPFFAACGVPELEEVNVVTPSYFQGLAEVIGRTGVDGWKEYLRFRVLDAAAPYLPKEFADAHFELHERTVSGIPEQKPRWKRAVDATAGGGAGDFGALGDALGQLYVKKHFPAESKRQMNELVGNLLKTYETSIQELTWMTAATKQKALEKLRQITTKIGYPDEWRDYSKLQVRADDLLGNVRRANEFEYLRRLSRLHLPVDRQEWGMTPQTVNAYYNPSLNEIVFPAAILQPPFFDAQADNAVNYGGIGAVIGHEISHGFDDQGSRYDARGNLANWWTDEDRNAYEALTSRLVVQFEEYEPLPGRKLNGKLTLGENIADLSGMAIAYKAYKLSLGNGEGPRIEGYTASQRFFLGWAQIWRRKYRDDELARRLVVDPHSPSLFRSNGPVRNFDPFYEAFNVKPGDKMFKPKAERIQIW